MSDRAPLTRHNATFLQWREALQACFEQPEEYDLASAIYPFTADYVEGLTPEQSFEAFDAWAGDDQAAIWPANSQFGVGA